MRSVTTECINRESHRWPFPFCLLSNMYREILVDKFSGFNPTRISTSRPRFFLFLTSKQTFLPFIARKSLAIRRRDRIYNDSKNAPR